MKVILLENVKRIGSIGEVIDVKRGFARNFLIANKKALYASKEIIKEVEKTEIKVNLFNPGGTRTAMRAQAFPGEDPSKVKNPENVAKQIIPLTLDNCEAMGEVIRAKD